MLVVWIQIGGGGGGGLLTIWAEESGPRYCARSSFLSALFQVSVTLPECRKRGRGGDMQMPTTHMGIGDGAEDGCVGLVV